MTMPLSINSALSQKVGSDVGVLNNVSGLGGMDVIQAVTGGPTYNGGLTLKAASQYGQTTASISSQTVLIAGGLTLGALALWVMYRKKV